MARLDQMPEPMQSHIRNLDCPHFETTPMVSGSELSERRVAIISTAGLHRRGDRPFGGMDGDYRVITGDTPAADLVMTHISTNFDRTGFQQDWNIVFPADRLRELADDGVIGSGADYHYSFMGACRPFQNGRACRNTGRASGRGPCQRSAFGAGLTVLHARRGRAGALPGGKRHRHDPDQPDL